jgi:hypothetical protein
MIFSFLAFFLFLFPGFDNGQPVDFTDKCVFPNNRFWPRCHWDLLQSDNDFVFRDEKSFEAFGRKVSNGTGACGEASLPYVDFSKYTLLAKYSSGGGCRVDYSRKVVFDSVQKKVVYYIDIEYEGYCEQLAFGGNFVLVPKIPDNYAVEIRLTEERIPDTYGVVSPKMDSLSQVSSDLLSRIIALQRELSDVNEEIERLARDTPKE